MTPVVGVFASRIDAQQGMERLESAGVTRDHINILTPSSTDEQIAAVPVSDAEQPGMAAAIGSVVGGALGSAGGFGAGAALASFLVPGVGPVLAGGLLGASLLGLGGLAGGAAAGDAIEERISGVPHDELYVYEDALRQGKTIIFVQPETDEQAEAARTALERAGAESIDAARDEWWIGLRSAELESYPSDLGGFDADEPYFRKGFEAAQSHALRGKSYDEAIRYLARRDDSDVDHPAFRRGYERGQLYRKQIM